MEYKSKARKSHCLVVAYPAQGHINPMLHFCKRLQQQHDEIITITLVTTRFFCNKLHKFPSSIALDTISDGFDNGGYYEAENAKVYFNQFREVGTQTLCELIEKLNTKGNDNHVDCIVYDPFLPWVLDVAKSFGIIGAIFLTQNLGVDSIYYHVNRGMLQLPLLEDSNISIPGLPSLVPDDMPSFLFEYGSEDTNLLVGQFCDIEKADWILCNTIYELEIEVADNLRKIWPKLRTIGPTIPYEFLKIKNGVKYEQEYGFAQFKSEEFTKWLDDQPKGSVVFVSFGTSGFFNEEQMEELAWGIRDSGINYVWVVRESEEAKLPKDFEKKSEKGLVVSWCNQMKVLSHEAIGCFVTHCGWNSTLEALSLGIPMVAIPGWSDQRTNAKFITDVWKVGVRAKVDDKEIVRRETLKNSIWEVMKGEKGCEIKNNNIKWKELIAMTIDKGGSSNNNIEEFVNDLVGFKSQV